jgi:hypothetical protein
MSGKPGARGDRGNRGRHQYYRKLLLACFSFVFVIRIIC